MAKGKIWMIVAGAAVTVALVVIFITANHDPTVPTEPVPAGATPVYTDSEGN